MRLEHCPNCGVPVYPGQKPEEHFDVPSPFPARYSVVRCTCSGCTRHVVMSSGNFGDQAVSGWLDQEELLRPGTDYDTILSSFGSRRIGMLPLTAVWIGHPLGLDPNFALQVQKTIVLESSRSLAEQGQARLLIAAPGVDTDWVFKHIPLFHEVWRLRSHVVTGSYGPLPSIRAELSIKRTLRGSKLKHVLHVWPSAVFSKADFRLPVGTDDKGLAKVWSTYARKHIYSKVTK